MKQETREAADRAAVAVVGTVSTWSLQEINQIVAALVGLATFIFVMAQLFFLLRKWHILEKHKWYHIKTTPGELDEQSGKNSGP